MARVTLEDFRELQKELLKAREALYDTETKVKAQALEIEKHRAVAALFSSASPQPPAPPVDGNPFGANPFGAAPSRDVGVQTDAAPEPQPPVEARPSATGTPAGRDETDEELTGASCTPKAAAAASVTPETSAVEGSLPPSPRRPVETQAVGSAATDRAGVALQRQRQRGLVRLVFHGWCAAHSNTKILRNMSGMAALMRQQQPAPMQQQVAQEPGQEPHERREEPEASSAVRELKARLTRLEEELAAADLDQEEAVAAAVAATKKEGESALDVAVRVASREAAAREAELADRVRALEADLAAFETDAVEERRRNAALLQELARALTATHTRTLAALEASQRTGSGGAQGGAEHAAAKAIEQVLAHGKA